jgi:hypothetical protein
MGHGRFTADQVGNVLAQVQAGQVPGLARMASSAAYGGM